MSQQRPTRAILAKSTDQRLAAIVRRLGGKDAAPDSRYRLPNPPREACAGQLDMFAVAVPVGGQDDDGWWPPEDEPAPF
jgi:hypothetical protein